MLRLIFLLSLSLAMDDFLTLEQFGKKDMKLGNKKITAYIADNSKEHAQGLMKVKSLPEDVGMLFIFSSEEPRTFWMKNTEIPLSIGFFDKNKKLLQILEMTPESPLRKEPVLYTSDKPAQFVLEMNKDWFTKNKIKVGSRLGF